MIWFRLSTSSKHKLNCQQVSNEACRLQSLGFSSPHQATLVGDTNTRRTFGSFLAKKAKQKPTHSSSVARNFVWFFISKIYPNLLLYKSKPLFVNIVKSYLELLK